MFKVSVFLKTAPQTKKFHAFHLFLRVEYPRVDYSPHCPVQNQLNTSILDKLDPLENKSSNNENKIIVLFFARVESAYYSVVAQLARAENEEETTVVTNVVIVVQENIRKEERVQS